MGSEKLFQLGEVLLTFIRDDQRLSIDDLHAAISMIGTNATALVVNGGRYEAIAKYLTDAKNLEIFRITNSEINLSSENLFRSYFKLNMPEM